jgi:hypothetical protein
MWESIRVESPRIGADARPGHDGPRASVDEAGEAGHALG